MDTNPYIYDPAALAGRPVFKGITIDHPVSPDMDDGINIARLPDGWQIDVSIADVTFLVAPRSSTAQTARRQSFTIYSHRPGRTRHMLPAYYACNSLSLLEGVDRPAVTVSMELDNNLEMRRHEIRRSVFQNQNRTAYKNVQNAFRDGDKELQEWFGLTGALAEKRRSKGAVMTPFPQAYKDAYTCVSEIMILANQTVASFCDSHKIPIIYRNQGKEIAPEYNDSPFAEALKKSMTVLHPGFTPARDLRGHYRAVAQGHAHLNIPVYTHFTSPLRRYVDLVTQQQLISYLENKSYPHKPKDLHEIALEADTREKLYVEQKNRLRAGDNHPRLLAG